MIIEISDDRPLEDLNEKFNDFFPFLKLSFFKGPHQWYEESDSGKELNPEMRIGDVRKKHAHGPISIYSWMRTGDVEQAFREQFDLNVQVFRLHAGKWIQTVGTDKLTLQEQNELGKNSSSGLNHTADSRTERKNLF